MIHRHLTCVRSVQSAASTASCVPGDGDCTAMTHQRTVQVPERRFHTLLMRPRKKLKTLHARVLQHMSKKRMVYGVFQNPLELVPRGQAALMLHRLLPLELLQQWCGHPTSYVCQAACNP